MYIWAGKSAPFLGDIKKKELLEQALVAEDAMLFIYIILPSTFPILNLWYSVSIYCVLMMCHASVGRSEKIRKGSCTPDLVVIERSKMSFCKVKLPPSICHKYTYSKGGLLSTEMKFFLSVSKTLNEVCILNQYVNI